MRLLPAARVHVGSVFARRAQNVRRGAARLVSRVGERALKGAPRRRAIPRRQGASSRRTGGLPRDKWCVEALLDFGL
jgi:hypothetical protein